MRRRLWRLSCLSALFLLLVCPVWGAGKAKSAKTPELYVAPMVLKATISKVKSLPPAMYGTWSIIATVLKSDAPPGAYSPAVNEIWALDKGPDVVTLSNVVTHAVASITVDQVDGNTATFHHEAGSPFEKMKILETPTITVDGDRISGINRQVISFYKKGKLLGQYHLEVQVDGTRLSGAKVTFGNREDAPLEFEVAPMQYKKQ